MSNPLNILLKIRAWCRKIQHEIEQAPKPNHTTKEGKRNRYSPIDTERAVISFDNETIRSAEAESKEDRKVQKQIRNAAWAAFLAASIYAVISAFQLNGLLQANRISHAALVATQRAYVSVTGLYIQQSRFNPKLVSYIVNPIIVNSGNTPTKNLWWTALVGTRPVTVDQEPTIEDLTGTTHNYGTLGARQEVRDLVEQPIPAEYAASLRQSYAQNHIPIYGAIVYEDGISSPPVIHVRRYCYSL